MSKSHRGFTLIEMLIAMAIVAIIAALAIPAYRDMARKNNVINQANSFLNLLTLARGEAVRGNRNVILCRTTSTTGCSGGSRWDQGVLMYTDLDNDSAYDTGEEVRIEVPLTRSVQITGSTDASFDVSSTITFRPDGAAAFATSPPVDGIFTVQTSSSDAFCARTIVVRAITGQLRVSSTTAACGS